MPVTSVRPIVERIAVEIYDRLRKLAAGYSTQTYVSEVVRPTRLGDWTPKHLQVVLKNGTSERVPELDCPGNPPAICRKQTYNIHCHFMPSEKDTTPIDEYVETMAGDVVRVVCDATLWHTFGNIAVDAEFGDAEFDSGDGSFSTLTIPLQVTYRTSELNPFEVRA